MMSDRTRDPMAPADADARLCGARTRQQGLCRHLAMANGRCRFHGGLSTGPRTADGLARITAAATVHGQRTASAREFRALLRELQKQARRTCEVI